MPSDWTTGAAKWAALIVLGSASLAGMAWALARPRPVVIIREPAPPDAPPRQAPQLKPAGEAPATAPITPAAPIASPATPRPSSSPANMPTHQINLNTATQAELELLPGIGPALAQRILDYRTANGRFNSVNDLDNVKGIGSKILERLRPLVSVE